MSHPVTPRGRTIGKSMILLTYHVIIAANKTLIRSKSFIVVIYISDVIFTFHRDISRRDK